MGRGFVDVLAAFSIHKRFFMSTYFLTAVEIAQILKISKALAYRLIAQGQITSIRFGRTVRVRYEALEEFIKKNSSEVDQNNLGIHKQKGGDL
jgi:excisionase family DNA binding protein